jgi:small subunit ribosomal protein S7e
MATTFTGRSKIKKGPGEKLEPIDEQVAQAIYDLQQSATSDLKADLRDLYIVKAQEVDVAAGKKVHLVFPCDCEKKVLFCLCNFFFAPSTHSFFLFSLSHFLKAIIVWVPVPLLRRFKQIHARLVRELEKKFSGRHVVIIGVRRILPPIRKTNRVKRQRRPRSRTLTAVHDAYLEDLVYPVEITGKRTRVRLDGSRLYRVYAFFL